MSGNDHNFNVACKHCFILGFMISREGFNGECDYEHLAPPDVRSDVCDDFESYKDRMMHNEKFVKLMKEAIG